MISVLGGCDNVEWGGVELSLRTPPPRDTVPATPELEEADFTRPLPSGPLLYLVERSSDNTVMRPLAEIADTGLIALPGATDSTWWEAVRATRTAPSAEFHVFADGTRVGRFTARGPSDTVRRLLWRRPWCHRTVGADPGGCRCDTIRRAGIWRCR